MENALKFSDYDLFAYVASGLAALVASDVLFSTHLVLDADWKFSTGAATVALAYVVGQIIASPAAFLFERQLMRKIFGTPSLALFDSAKPRLPRFVSDGLLRDYYAPLRPDIRQRVIRRAQKEGKGDEPGESLFMAAFPVAKKDERAYARMESFLKLYGFCRNASFVAITAAALLAGKAVLSLVTDDQLFHQEHATRWLALAIVVGIGLYFRYLKFLRLYAFEVFITYSDETVHGHSSSKALQS